MAILEFRSTKFKLVSILLLQSKFRLKATKSLGRDVKIDFQDGGCGGHLGFSIGSFSYFVSTRCPNASSSFNSTGL